MPDKKPKQPRKSPRQAAWEAAEVAYAQGVMHHTLGNKEASLTALEKALSLKADYPPAVLTMASIEYQLNKQDEGKERLFSLLKLPRSTEDLPTIIDEAGSFLISIGAFGDGLEFYRKAAKRFPEIPAFHQGIGCCAGQEGLFDDALEASRKAIDLDPGNAAYISDMGWTLVLAERFGEAEATFKRALEIDPSNERAQMNLQYCREQLSLAPPNPTEKPAAPPKKRKPRRS